MLSALSIAGVIAAVPRDAAADPTVCVPSRAMVVLDKSSSMVTGSIGGTTKWSIAATAISQVLGTYEQNVEFGLVTFPRPNQCGPGQQDVAPALGNQAAIAEVLQAPPPDAGNWTPMAQTLQAAANLPTWEETAAPKYVILISDGWQWCSPYDPATRFAGEQGIVDLNAKGIKTFVVGFGAAVDALALGRMAVLAGSHTSGCDVTATDPSNPDVCYYQADNLAQLQAALAEIVGTVATDEICDGLDNDCDGEVDENLSRDCATACGGGSETCENGTWGACDAPQPGADICDGLDNDCDGAIDPGCECVDGDARTCGEDTTEGVCQPGTQLCEGGVWGACEGLVVPGEETCDNLDNDCDGDVDEETPSPSLALWLTGRDGLICDPGQICIDGTCVTPTDPTGSPFDETGAKVSSCACRGGGGPGDLAAFGLIGAILFLRRRRSA
ncbi:MAG: VWA domain-containing protein [Myxococcales bacterium]|nr:VWA domain-containing protein [Myxococcales bacterium]